MRVTNNISLGTVNFELSKHNKELNKLYEKIATSKNVLKPSDAPDRISNIMNIKSKLTRLKIYTENAQVAMDRLKMADSVLTEVTDILRRFKVLAIQGSQGTYSSFELKEAMASEINELLHELVRIANSQTGDGHYIFGGTDTKERPFIPIYDVITAGRQGEAMTRVEYRGNIEKMKKELSEGEYVDVNIPGNWVFWATNQVLESRKDSSNYVAPTDQEFKIDGVTIKVAAGDTLDRIIEKINASNVQVTASKGPGGTLVLTTTTPHQIWLEDVGAGTVLQDLGMIDPNKPLPPNNLRKDVQIGGLSIFDLAIQLRDDLVKGDHELVGGRDLGAIELALENILKNRAIIGAKIKRIEHAVKKMEVDKTDYLEALSKEEDLDIPKAIMELRWGETVHQYSLAVAARIIKPTLLDYLR